MVRQFCPSVGGFRQVSVYQMCICTGLRQVSVYQMCICTGLRQVSVYQMCICTGLRQVSVYQMCIRTGLGQVSVYRMCIRTGRLVQYLHMFSMYRQTCFNGALSSKPNVGLCSNQKLLLVFEDITFPSLPPPPPPPQR